MPGGCQACILPDSYGVPGAPGLGGVVLHISCIRSTSQPTDFTFSIGRCEVKRKIPIQAKPAWMGTQVPETLGDAHCPRSSEEGRIGIFSGLMAEKCIRRQKSGCSFRGERLRIKRLEMVPGYLRFQKSDPLVPRSQVQHSIMHSDKETVCEHSQEN